MARQELGSVFGCVRGVARCASRSGHRVRRGVGGEPSRVLEAPGSRCSVNYTAHARLCLCVCVCVRTLTPVPTSEGHRFPGGQAVLINLTFINGFLSLFDFMCELPATQQQAMGMDNTTGGEDGGRALQLPDQ